MTLATRKALDMLNGLGVLLDSSSDLHDKPITTHQAVSTLFDLLEEDFIPKPNLKDTDWNRYQHIDLHDMDARDLGRERGRAEFLMLWCSDNTDWIAERYTACVTEAKRRATSEKKKANG